MSYHRTFMEDSEDYHADYYEGYRHHSSVNLFKTTTQKPHPHPPPHLTKPRDIFSEHEFLYVFNICLVLIFLLQVVLIYLCLARRRFRNRFRADLEAMQVQFHAGGGAGNNFGVGGHPGIGGFVTGAAPAG